LLVKVERLSDQRGADTHALGMLIGVVVVEVGDRRQDGEALTRGVDLAGALTDRLAENRVAVTELLLEMADLNRVADAGEKLGLVDRLRHEVTDTVGERPAAD